MGPASIVFTDLVGSTELLARSGDEAANWIFRTHHDHGGQEVKWLGDGLMVAFSSAAAGLHCALGMRRLPETAAA